MRRNYIEKIVIIIFIISALTAARIPAGAAAPMREAAAVSALLIEKDSGIILYEQEIYRRHPADALAKIMTLYLASIDVEDGTISDNELVEMTEEAWESITESNSTLDIQPGQVMTFIDLMYCAYIGNADEACNMIAIYMEGSVDAFVRRMNGKARELGLADTNFVNPHGIYHHDQYTTAYDLYVLYCEALRSGPFGEIASTYRYVTAQTEDAPSRTLVSGNSLMNQNSIYYYRYCLTGRGSNTFEGGYSLISSAEEEGLALISVVLGAREVVNDDSSVTLRHFTETNRLFTWGYSNFGWREVVKTTDLLAKVPIEHGAGADFVNVRPERPLIMLLETSITLESFVKDVTIYSQQEGAEKLVAPISAGDVLGEVTISRNGIVHDTIALVANTDIELNGFEYMRRQLADILFTPIEELAVTQPELTGIAQTVRTVLLAVGIITAIYIALVIRYNIIRINRIRKIKNAKKELIEDRH